MNIKNAKSIIKINHKKGSMFVEAAIVLPIFFLAILSIVLNIRLAAVEVNTMECFSKVSQDYAKEMYLLNRKPLQDTNLGQRLLQDFSYELRVKKKVENTEKLKLQKLRVERLPISKLKVDSILGSGQGLVDASLMYEVDLTFPLRFGRGLSFQEHLFFRGFIGRESKGEGFGFDEMEKSDDPNLVYVFPRAGERFHRADCRIIEVYPVEKILSPTLKKKYSPCKLCKAGNLPYGCKVYCFESTGKVYHKGLCTTVDRYVIEMDKEEAIEKGYTPCAYCGSQ